MKNLKLHPLLLAFIIFSVLTVGIALGRLSPLRGNSLSDSGNSRTEYEESSSLPENAEIGKININTAGTDELSLLPGIGPALSERIIQYREDTGPFAAPEDLMNVKGIGQKTYNRISEYITVGG